MRRSFGNRNVAQNREMAQGYQGHQFLSGFGNRNIPQNREMTQGMRRSFMPQNREMTQGYQGHQLMRNDYANIDWLFRQGFQRHQLSVKNQSLIILQIIGRSKLQMWGRTDC